MTPHVLIDECVPRRLTRDFPKGTAVHVRDLEWTGLKNGRLLAAMREKGLTVLVTVDKNLSFQQNLGTTGIAVIVMHAITNRRPDLAVLVPRVLEMLTTTPPGSVQHVGV